FAKLRSVDAGFRAERVLTAALDLNWSRYTLPEHGADHERLVSFHKALEDPVGRRISGDDGKTWSTVVGVVGDMRNSSLEQEPKDTLYVPFLQFPGFS